MMDHCRSAVLVIATSILAATLPAALAYTRPDQRESCAMW